MSKRILLAVIAIVALFGLGSSPALAASANFNVSVTIRQAISITKVTDLTFGTVDAAATTYTVNANGSAQTGAGTGATAASFTISGESAAVANVTFSANPVTVTCAACAGTPTLSVTLTPQATTHTFTGASETFYVGGSVTPTVSTASGAYTGTATLNLIYQ